MNFKNFDYLPTHFHWHELFEEFCETYSYDTTLYSLEDVEEYCEGLNKEKIVIAEYSGEFHLFVDNK